MKAALLAVFLVFSAPLWAHGNQEGSAECSDKVLEEVPSTMSGVLEALRTEMRVILLEDKKIVASLRELRQLALGTRLHATEDLQYLYLFVRGLNIAERLKPILNAADRLHYHHNRRIQQLKTELPEPVDTRLGMLVAGFTSLFRKALPGLRERGPSQEILNAVELGAHVAQRAGAEAVIAQLERLHRAARELENLPAVVTEHHGRYYLTSQFRGLDHDPLWDILWLQLQRGTEASYHSAIRLNEAIQASPDLGMKNIHAPIEPPGRY